MGNTDENLQAAFARESQANRKYLFFADVAEEAGYKQVARLLRAAAEAETVHARNHLKVMGGIKSTSENVKVAVSGENYECTEMYPGFIEKARSDNNASAVRSFDLANKVERIHLSLFQEAGKSLETSEPFGSLPYSVCQVCGNTIEGDPPEVCSICGSSRSKFNIVD